MSDPKPRKRQRDETRGRAPRSGSARGAKGRGASTRGAKDHGAKRRSAKGAGSAEPSTSAKRPYPRKATSPKKGAGRAKRTSKNTDQRNPTRSGIDYPSPKFRAKGGGAPTPEGPRERPALRKVSRSRDEAKTRAPRSRKPRAAPPVRRRRGVKTTEATEELARLAGRNARSAQQQLAAAAEAFAAGRERDAMRLLRPLREAYPDASAVRELLGLCHYRLGQYAAAAKELDAFVALTDSVEQHPVLMDCARATGKYRRVDELWEELAAASPTSALVTEGRIVLAGARADRGRLQEAIATLDRRAATPARVQDHHLRLWYALADLYERAGEVPKARELFGRIRRYDAGFADVAERLAALR